MGRAFILIRTLTQPLLSDTIPILKPLVIERISWNLAKAST